MKMLRSLCLLGLYNLLACEAGMAASPPQAPLEVQRAHAAVAAALRGSSQSVGAPTRGTPDAGRPPAPGAAAAKLGSTDAASGARLVGASGAHSPAVVGGPAGARGPAIVGGPASRPAVSVGGPAPAKITNRSVIGGAGARPR